MITQVLKLTRWEWYKLRRRRMPWILLAIAIVMPQIAFWSSYATYQGGGILRQSSFGTTTETHNGQTVEIDVTCQDLVTGTLPSEIENLSQDQRSQFLENLAAFEAESCQELLEAQRRILDWLVLPNSIVLSLGFAHSLGAILIVILASSTIGIEYGLGTLRTTLAKGVGRWRLVASKALLLALLSAAALLVVSIATVVSSSIVVAIAPDAAADAAGAGDWSQVAIGYGKTIYGLLPYVALAMFFAILTSSSGVGTAIVLGYYFAERIVVALLFNFDWFEKVAGFILGRAIDGWVNAEGSLTVQIGRASAELPDALHASLVMLGYIVILGALTFWLFRRRDIAGAKGD